MSDLLELFSRDPLSYTKEGGEVVDIIMQFREKRSSFNLGNLTAGRAAPKATKESKAVAATGLTLDLSHLLKK